MQVIKKFQRSTLYQDERGNYLLFSHNNIVLKHTRNIVEAYEYGEHYDR